MPRQQQVEVEPLAPGAASNRINIDKDAGLPTEIKPHRHRKYIMCCGCITALILIIAVVVCVLIFTVFGRRWPDIRVNSVKIEGFDRVNWTDIGPNTNLSIIADVSIKNPNIASFKFNNASTMLYYDGNVIGAAKTPRATAKAGRTLRLNVTTDVMIAKIMNVSRLQGDYLAGILPISSYTRISGRVKILNMIKKGAIVRTNCTILINVTSYAIKLQDCKRKVSL